MSQLFATFISKSPRAFELVNDLEQNGRSNILTFLEIADFVE